MAEPAYLLDDEYHPDTSHLITEDDEPLDSVFQERQQKILVDVLGEEQFAGRPFVALSNVGLFFSIREQAVVPDMMLSLDVRLLQGRDKKSYFVWEYGKSPELVIEVVSKKPGGESDKKIERYSRAGVIYYVIYDPFAYQSERPLKLLELHAGQYVEVIDPTRLPILGLGLTVWTGRYQDYEGPYLRFTDQKGQLLPTGRELAESAQAQAAQETNRASQEAARAEQEAARAEQESARAEQEAARAEQEAARAEREAA